MCSPFHEYWYEQWNGSSLWLRLSLEKKVRQLSCMTLDDLPKFCLMWIWKSFTDSRRQKGRSPMLLYFVRLLLMEWHFSLCIRCLFGYVADSLNRRMANSYQSLVLFNVPLSTSRRQLNRTQHTLPLFIKSDCAKYTKVALIEIIYIEMHFKYQNKY